MELQEMQLVVDISDQTDSSSQQMDGPDASLDDGSVSVRNVIVNVAGRELRPKGHGILFFIQAAFQTTLAFVEPAGENRSHLKSSCGRGAWECSYFIKHRKSRRISSFFQNQSKKIRKSSLVQGLVG